MGIPKSPKQSRNTSSTVKLGTLAAASHFVNPPKAIPRTLDRIPLNRH